MKYGLDKETSFNDISDHQLDNITQQFVDAHPVSGQRSLEGFFTYGTPILNAVYHYTLRYPRMELLYQNLTTVTAATYHYTLCYSHTEPHCEKSSQRPHIWIPKVKDSPPVRHRLHKEYTLTLDKNDACKYYHDETTPPMVNRISKTI